MCRSQKSVSRLVQNEITSIQYDFQILKCRYQYITNPEVSVLNEVVLVSFLEKVAKKPKRISQLGLQSYQAEAEACRRNRHRFILQWPGVGKVSRLVDTSCTQIVDGISQKSNRASSLSKRRPRFTNCRWNCYWLSRLDHENLTHGNVRQFKISIF